MPTNYLLAEDYVILANLQLERHQQNPNLPEILQRTRNAIKTRASELRKMLRIQKNLILRLIEENMHQAYRARLVFYDGPIDVQGCQESDPEKVASLGAEIRRVRQLIGELDFFDLDPPEFPRQNLLPIQEDPPIVLQNEPQAFAAQQGLQNPQQPLQQGLHDQQEEQRGLLMPVERYRMPQNREPRVHLEPRPKEPRERQKVNGRPPWL